jgi:hypothetical protein
MITTSATSQNWKKKQNSKNRIELYAFLKIKNKKGKIKWGKYIGR